MQIHFIRHILVRFLRDFENSVPQELKLKLELDLGENV